MLDQLRQVAIFAKTIDHGSFRGAARELGLSPSVVSHHVSQLEEYLGVALIYRTTRKLALTQEGERLLTSTHPMLETMESVLSELSSSATSPGGELRLSTPSILVQSQLTEMLAAFSIKHPGIKLVLDYSDERKDIIAGGYDIAIRMGIHQKGSPTTRTLFQVSRCLIASTGYIRDRPKAKTPEDLLSWDWIVLAPVRHIKPTFRKSKSEKTSIKPTAHISTNSALAMYQLTRAGAGLTVVPEFLARQGVISGEVKYVLPDWKLDPINVYAEWPSNAPKNGLINLLVNEISPDQSLR